MPAALVGSLGAPTQPAVGASASPAWGTGETRVAGHLGVLWTAAFSATTVSPPAAPTGWSQLSQFQSGQTIVTIFVITLAGGDAAPTVTGISGVQLAAMLAEFSGVKTATLVDQTATASGFTSPVIVTLPAPDLKIGELFLDCVGPTYSVAATQTFVPSFNNGTAFGQSNTATSTKNHYYFGYAITQGTPTAADSLTFGFTVTNIAACPAVGTSVQVLVGTINATACSIALPAASVATTGVRTVIGQASLPLGGVSVAATGIRPVIGHAAVTLPVLSISTISRRTTFGSSALHLGALTVNVPSDLVAVTGTALIALGNVSVGATGVSTTPATGSVVLAATAGLSVTGTLPVVVHGDVSMAVESALNVRPSQVQTSSFQAVAVTSMFVLPRLASDFVMTGRTALYVEAESAAPPRVNLQASAGMTVTGVVEHVVPSLEDQLVAVGGQDPILMGATGYLDNVFTSRLTGDSE